MFHFINAQLYMFAGLFSGNQCKSTDEKHVEMSCYKMRTKLL